jgi:hypothetical protein
VIVIVRDFLSVVILQKIQNREGKTTIDAVHVQNALEIMNAMDHFLDAAINMKDVRDVQVDAVIGMVMNMNQVVPRVCVV